MFQLFTDHSGFAVADEAGRIEGRFIKAVINEFDAFLGTWRFNCVICKKKHKYKFKKGADITY